MKAFWNVLARNWCRAFHPEPMWPMHGRYLCPACSRAYPVPWGTEDCQARSRSLARTRHLELTAEHPS